MGTRHDLGTSRQLLFLVPAAMLRWAGCARAVLCRGAGAGVWRTESLPLLRPGLAAGLAPRVAAGYHSSPVARADILGSVLDEVTKGDEAKTKGEVEDPLEHISGGTAHKDFALAKRKNQKGSPLKYQRVMNVIRGLSVSEAMAQMQPVIHTRYGRTVHGLLSNAQSYAVHNYGLQSDRLIVDECWATKAKYLPRVEFHSRGRAGRKHKYFSHVFVKVKEAPSEESRRRLGRVGRTMLKNQMNELWEEQMESRYEEIRTELEKIARSSQEEKVTGH